MKKFSMILVVVTLLAVCLVGATAFASSLVETEQNIYVGEYAHNNPNNDDPNVVIVYGTASTDEDAGITERGVVVSDGNEYSYFRAWNYDETTGKFGIAIIRNTIEKGGYTARAYAKVGGAYDETAKVVLGYTSIDVGEEVSLNFGATLAQTETDITVTAANPVDLKNFITVEGGSIDEVTYSVSTENGEIEVDSNGIVSYGNKAGRYTVTATHILSGNSVTFNVMAYDEEYEITEASQLATLNTDHANSYVKLMRDVFVETADMVEDIDGNNDTSAYVIGGTFKGFFDGQNNQIKYDFRYMEKDMLFRGVFFKVAGEIRNLLVEGFSDQKDDYGYAFIDSVISGAVVENCYVKATIDQRTSRSGNNASTRFIIGTNSGTVKDTVFNVQSWNNSASGTAGFSKGIGLQRYGNGHWYDIAWISAARVESWRGGINFDSPNKPAGQLHNVVHYTDVDNFVAGVGETYTIISAGTTVGETTYAKDTDNYETITEAQTMGSSWIVDATGVSLNGELVAPIKIETDQHITTSTGSIVFTPGDAKTTEQIYMAYKGKASIDYVYSSSNKNVATVSSTGLVTKVGVGTAIITVRHVFSNYTTRIPVTVAEVAYEVDSAEDLALLTPAKATELGASSTATVYAYLTKDITVTKSDMVTFKESSGVVWYSIIPSGNFTSGKETTADAFFSGVLDGKGYKLTFEFEADSYKEAFSGITYGTNTSTIIRNLSYEGIGVVTGIDSTTNTQGWRNYSGITYTNKGVIDNCFVNAGYIPINMLANDSGNNYIYRIGTHSRLVSVNSGGIFRNSIVHLSNYRAGSEGGGLLVINSSDDGFCENVAGVLLNKAMATMSGVAYSKAYANQIRNICYYASFDKLIEGSGTLVTMTDIDSTSKQFNNYAGNKNMGTEFTGGQGLTNWTMNATDGTITMNFDGESKVVYKKATLPAVTISSNNVKTMVVGETIQLTALEGDAESTNVRFVTNAFNSVATITQDGKLTAVGAGSVKVYAVNPITRKLSSAITITITAA